jgi:quercetin dioxygenase-like cupin family protein
MTTVVDETALLSLVEAIAALRAQVEGPAHLAVVESTMRRGQMPPLHSHEVDEVFFVLEGTMIVHTGGQPVRLEAGEALVARRELAHTHQAESDRVRYLSMAFTRSLARYEDFLRAVGAPRPNPQDGSGHSDPDGWRNTDEAAAVAGIARANGIAVLGPPGTLPAG